MTTELHPDDWFALLRIGVRLTLDEVLALDDSTRQALYRASVRLDAERAAQVAVLVREGMDAYPSIAREADDGAGLEGSICAKALEQAMAHLGTRVPA